MYPDDLRYTKKHEWIRDEEGIYAVGITAFAAEQLGDVTYVELPEIGQKLEQGGEAATVESVKAASDIYAPLDGEVVETNDALEDTPELVNESPYENGWFFKLKDVNASEINSLMDAADYEQFTKEQEH